MFLSEVASLKTMNNEFCGEINRLRAANDEFKKWSIEVATTINNLQLKTNGLKPLHDRFGPVLGPLAK